MQNVLKGYAVKNWDFNFKDFSHEKFELETFFERLYLVYVAAIILGNIVSSLYSPRYWDFENLSGIFWFIVSPVIISNAIQWVLSGLKQKEEAD